MPARRGSGTAHGGPHERLHRTGELDLLAVLRLHVRRRGPAGVDPDPGHVLAGEGRGLEGALGGLVEAGGGGARVAAVPRRGEALLVVLGDGEPDGAAGPVVDVEGVAADEVLQDPRLVRRDLDLHVLGRHPGGRQEGGRRRLAGGLDGDPVGHHVDVPHRGLPGPGPHGGGVELLLDGAQLGQVPADDRRLGALCLDGRGVRGVGGGDGQLGGGRAAHPGPGEAVAQRVAQHARAGARLRLVDQPGRRLTGRQLQVALHRAQHARRGHGGVGRAGRGGPRCRGGWRGCRRGRGECGQDQGAERGEGCAAAARGMSADHAMSLLRVLCETAVFGGATVGHGAPAAKSQALPQRPAGMPGAGRFRAMGDVTGAMCSTRARSAWPKGDQAGLSPGSPASVTKDAAVVTAAPGVLMAETVRKSRWVAWRPSSART